MVDRVPGARVRVMLVVALGLSVVACSDGRVAISATPSATNVATASPSPAATPAATPALTLTPTEAPTPSPTPTLEPTAKPTPAATPAPTPRPTAKPTATPKPTVAPSDASRLVRHGSRAGDRVALTFDMGGRVGDAVAIVQWLIDHDVQATIFMTGAMADNANTDAGRTVLAMVAAHPGLFDLGNHSYSHPDFRDIDAAAMRDEIESTDAAIARVTDVKARPLFRPPYGGVDDRVLAGVGAAGYGWTILWDIDTIDWRAVSDDGPTSDGIRDKVLDNAKGGSIVLMHLGGYHTLDALPGIVDGLRADGLEPATLERLLGL